MKTLRTQTTTRTAEVRGADDAMTRDSFEPARPRLDSPAPRADAAGRRARRSLDAAAEDRYWREQYRHEPYYDTALGYEDYAPAYRLGYQAHERYPGEDFARIEERLRFEYEGTSGPRLGWERAKSAARAAWQRTAQAATARDGR